MARGIEVDADIVLGLIVGKGRTCCRGMCPRALEIVDGYSRCIIICWSVGPAGQVGRA
jgi:hypothetical protein